MSYIAKRMHHSIYAVCAYSMFTHIPRNFLRHIVLFPSTAAVVGDKIMCSHLYLSCFPVYETLN